MIVVRLIFAVLAAALTGAIFWAMGADGRPLGEVVRAMLADPWSVVALTDLYIGFFTAAVVIFLFERSPVVAFIWAAPIFVLGNVVTALWFILRLPELARRLRG